MRGPGWPRRVRLRFTAEAARWVGEKQWHPTQRLCPRKDGRLEVSFRLTHLAEVKRWVLSYGASCEVLEPAELRQQVVEELRRMLSEYKKMSFRDRKELSYSSTTVEGPLSRGR